MGLDVPFDKFQGVISFGSCLVYMSTPCEVICLLSPRYFAFLVVCKVMPWS